MCSSEVHLHRASYSLCNIKCSRSRMYAVVVELTRTHVNRYHLGCDCSCCRQGVLGCCCSSTTSAFIPFAMCSSAVVQHTAGTIEFSVKALATQRTPWSSISAVNEETRNTPQHYVSANVVKHSFRKLLTTAPHFARTAQLYYLLLNRLLLQHSSSNWQTRCSVREQRGSAMQQH
jgi:hypothetical protein